MLNHDKIIFFMRMIHSVVIRETSPSKRPRIRSRLCAERIECEKSLGVTNLKREIRLVKENLASIEDTVYNLQNKVFQVKPHSRIREGLIERTRAVIPVAILVVLMQTLVVVLLLQTVALPWVPELI